MEFRRIENLPPYVFTIINNLKIEARRAGRDVIDLGFGNPDIPSPDIAVQKLAEAATKPTNHRYSLSRGLPKLREAIAGYYEKNWGVELDPELEITNTIGSKEGFSHLMWVLPDRGDAAIVPSPSYPIHIYGPLFAGADMGFDGYRPPSILQAEGAKECAVELYSMTKSFSMAGWRVAFLLGNT